jgi:hypothetical protein
VVWGTGTLDGYSVLWGTSVVWGTSDDGAEATAIELGGED